MRWIALPLVAAAVGGVAIALPEARSVADRAPHLVAAAATMTPIADAAAVPVDAAPAEAPSAPPPPAEEPKQEEPPPVEPPAEPAPAPPVEEPPAPVDPPPAETPPPADTPPPATEPDTSDPAIPPPPAGQAPPPPPASAPSSNESPATEPPSTTPTSIPPPAPAQPAPSPAPAPAAPARTTKLITPDVTPAARQTDSSALAPFESSSVDGLGGMSPVAAQAYVAAARWAKANLPACALDASFLAGIGKVESDHATVGGAELRPDGETSAPIRNEAGAQGPMHFLPSEWAKYAADGNGDGVLSPDNMYDATIAAAKKLCALAGELPDSGGTLASEAARQRVAYAFDHGAAALFVDDAHAAEAVRFADSVRATLDSYGDSLEGADRRIAQVVTWMRQQMQLGARYAATNPGRFGTAWDGSPKRSFISGRMYQYPAGTITYDCSGLMVVGFRQVGVDLEKLDASWTGSMLANLPRIPRDKMQVGDLIILGTASRTTHVVMYLGQDRYIHAGSCGGTMGVCERKGIDWSRVAGVVRVPLGEAPAQAS